MAFEKCCEGLQHFPFDRQLTCRCVQMTTYKVMTTMKADRMDEVPDARYSAARRNGYSVAHLGPGNATKQEMLETWLLLEVRACQPAAHADQLPTACCPCCALSADGLAASGCTGCDARRDGGLPVPVAPLDTCCLARWLPVSVSEAHCCQAPWLLAMHVVLQCDGT